MPAFALSRYMKTGMLTFMLLTQTGLSRAGSLSEDDLVQLTAVDAAQLIKQQKITSKALVTALIKRARQFASLNAYITLAEQQALARAVEADKLVAAGRSTGRLHGVPVIVKDNIEVAGIPSTAGTPGLKDYIPDNNAAIVQALIDEGAIIIGKANMHELAFGTTSNNKYFGAVANPHKLDHFAGGSSGGTAAAVAAHIAIAGLGTDTGGSVRIPAALTGIYGFRPSTGRYSAKGLLLVSNTKDTAGPMTKSVADLILLDAVMTGQEADFNPVPVASIKLGMPKELFYDDLEQELKDVIDHALDKIRHAGIELVAVGMPDIEKVNNAVGFPISRYEARRNLPAYLENSTDNYISLADFVSAIASADVKGMIEQIVAEKDIVTEQAYHDAINHHRPALQQLYQDVFSQHELDGLIFPTTLLTARPIQGSDKVVSVNGKEVPTFSSYVRNTNPASNAGIPGVTLPAGMTAAGLPVGLEIDGAKGSDTDLLRIALTIEKILAFQK